jgi:hypothetical protein
MEYHGFDTVNDAPARVSDEELNRKLHHHRIEGSEGMAKELTSRRKDSQLDLYVTGPTVSLSAEFARVHRGRRLLARRACAVAGDRLSSASAILHVQKLLPLLLLL